MKTEDRPLPGSKLCLCCGAPVFRKLMSTAKYCSVTCQDRRLNWRPHPSFKLCLNCGKPFSRIRMWSAKYCGQKCKDAMNNRSLSRKMRPKTPDKLSRYQQFIRISKMRDHLDNTVRTGTRDMTKMEEKAYLAVSGHLHELAVILGRNILKRRNGLPNPSTLSK